ncbi:MAG: DNA translocase FtsK 4TM domain-containing protein [Christensenellaceae bacterium]|jgi:S-DNA-T family DNA segregation ATPase FtsK/SpoIIIE
MAGQKKKNGKAKQQNIEKQVRLRSEVVGIIYIALAILFGVFIYFSYDAPFGKFIQVALFGMFGFVAYLVPLLLALLGVLTIVYAGQRTPSRTIWLLGVSLICILALLDVCATKTYGAGMIGYFAYLKNAFTAGQASFSGGGFLGGLIGYPFERLFGNLGAIIIFAAGLCIGLVLLTRFSIKDFWVKTAGNIKEARARRPVYIPEDEYEVIEPEEEAAAEWEEMVRGKFANARGQIEEPEEKELYIADLSETEAEETEAERFFAEAPPAPMQDVSLFYDLEGDLPKMSEEEAGKVELAFGETTPRAATPKTPNIEPEPKVKKAPVDTVQENPVKKERRKIGETPVAAVAPKENAQEYQLPYRLDLLDAPGLKGASAGEKAYSKGKAAILEQTLRDFNVEAEVINIVHGPTVTRYELQPAPGIKVSRIVGLSNDIALSLAAPSIRMEAPIPGKSAVGIEVPNTEVATVQICELLDTAEFRKQKSNLTFAVGKDITGKNIYGDLSKMPHLLIAGTTGAGKSVCVNTIILSILYKSSPEEVELMMIDPKVVEMQKFNGIPHMKTNVVTDPKKAPGLLYQAVNTMLERYKVFAKEGVRDIDSFNVAKRKKGEKIMAKQVIIIDELADLMMANAKEVEDSICRIAQLGRASGIHLVIATQSPRVDVITGLIKANIPSRIALTVSSSIDSRTILDMSGAEKLLGKGDMLYMPIGQNKPLRVQGCFVSDAENARVISFLQNEGLESNYDENLTKEIEENTAAPAGNGGGGAGEMGSDDLIPKAIELALEYEQISTSMLQRRLRVGYARAARLVDELEMMEIVTPADGNKPREVLITWADYRERFGGEEEFPYEDS